MFLVAAQDDEPPRLLVVGRRGAIGRFEDRLQVAVRHRRVGEGAATVPIANGRERFIAAQA